MKKFIIFFLCVPLVYSDLHRFISTYTEIRGLTIEGIPEFSAVTTLDDQQIYYNDSNIKKLIPKQDWMKEFTSEELWKKYMEVREKQQQIYKNNIHVIMQRFNQSQGVHTYQRMYGCEWDDETGDSQGFDQYGYDGDDFISLDLRENRYNVSVLQATTTVQKWNKDREQLTLVKQYYDHECVHWLKEFLTLRKEAPRIRAPEVSLLQKHPSSPVVCHATGFYPSGVSIIWFKNGQEHNEDVDLGETLPNEDGTFQKSSILRVSPDEWKNNKFSCKMEQQGKTIRKTEDEIKTPEVSLLQKNPSSPLVCHATGFYPSRVSITWFRNGQEHHEDVDLGETLPNEDETFQKTSSIHVSPDEWKNYQFSCEVEHQGKTIRKTDDEIKRLPTLWTKQGFPSAASHLTKTYPRIHVLLCVMGVFIFAL